MKHFLILTCAFYFFLLTFKLITRNSNRNKTVFCFIYITIFALSFVAIVFSNTETLWQKSADGIRESKIKCVLFDSAEPNLVFAGTDRAIYLSKDGGKYYRKVLNLSQSGGVNFLSQDRARPQNIFAATADGLFVSQNKGKSWQNIFRGKNEMQRYCNSVLALKDKILLGTKEGLFFSRDNAKSWNKVSGELGRIEIVAMDAGEGEIYIATIEGIYVLSEDLESQDKLYSLTSKEAAENNNGDSDYVSDEAGVVSRISDIKIDPKNHRNIYFSSDEGLFYSKNDGESWQRFNSSGLLSKNIKCILLDGRLIIGTDKGIFEFNANRWQELYKGIIANNINFLATDSLRQLWAATDEGVFRGSSRELPAMKRDELENTQEVFKDEPSIQEIQKQAIRYAEVQPEKIEAWRKAAAKSAWLPSLSVGVDGDKNLTTGDSVWGSYTSGGQVYVGPDDKTFYDNFGWDVSLSWDLGDLIWNSDQTSIDSRSKLMVELRGSILDEVTRLYFERRRLQTELLISPPEEASERLDKTLRLEELTASIDALTGGYLSEQLKMQK